MDIKMLIAKDFQDEISISLDDVRPLQVEISMSHNHNKPYEVTYIRKKWGFPLVLANKKGFLRRQKNK